MSNKKDQGNKDRCEPCDIANAAGGALELCKQIDLDCSELSEATKRSPEETLEELENLSKKTNDEKAQYAFQLLAEYAKTGEIPQDNQDAPSRSDS